MGGAMLEGWLKNMSPDVRFNIVDPNINEQDLPNDERITKATNPVDIHDEIADSNLVLFANKPQIMKEVCEQWQGHIPDNAALAMICAGIPIAFPEAFFGKDRTYIRMMPNTPAAIGKGITGIYAKNASDKTKALIEKVVAPLGKSTFVEKESDINAVTAISGSGPAYVFYLAEYMSQTFGTDEGTIRDFIASKAKDLKETGEITGRGEKEDMIRDFLTAMMRTAVKDFGFEPEQAALLINETFIGAAAMMAANPNKPANALRKDVTSEKGTTEAALKIMMKGDLMGGNDAGGLPRGWKVMEGMKDANARGAEIGAEQLAKIGITSDHAPEAEEKLEA